MEDFVGDIVREVLGNLVVHPVGVDSIGSNNQQCRYTALLVVPCRRIQSNLRFASAGFPPVSPIGSISVILKPFGLVLEWGDFVLVLQACTFILISIPQQVNQGNLRVLHRSWLLLAYRAQLWVILLVLEISFELARLIGPGAYDGYLTPGSISIVNKSRAVSAKVSFKSFFWILTGPTHIVPYRSGPVRAIAVKLLLNDVRWFKVQ